MKYIFIVNPVAGSEFKRKMFARIRSTFRLIDDEMIEEVTHKRGDAMRISKHYAEKYGKDCVIVSCGGDGTIHEIANGIAHTDTPLMVLPLGTGNDFAKKIYGTKKINVENVIKAFGFYNGKIKYDVMPIDLIDYNGEKCINVMSFGMDVFVETYGKQIAAKIPGLGANAYNLAVIPVIAKPLHYDIAYEVDCINEKGEKYKFSCNDKDYALWAICNASYYGGGFCPAPNSKLDDGILDFLMCDGLPFHEALPIIPKYAAGTATNEIFPQITCGKCVSGRVWMPDGSKLMGECDGENFLVDEVNFKVEHKALKLCVLRGY